MASFQGVPTAGLLRFAYNRLSIHIFQAVIDAGFADLRPSHGNVLEQLSYDDGARLRDLAERAGMTAQSVGELVDGLEALGYVERRRDPADRRAKRVFLTERGHSAQKVADTAMWSGEERVRVLLGEEAYARLRLDLGAIIEAEQRDV